MDSDSALSRLAARDAASIIAHEISLTADDDMIAAMSRIIGELNVRILDVRYVYPRLIGQLQRADLTINFFAYKFFNKKPTIEKYVSQFEGGNTWGDPTYMNIRDEAEEAMFDYSGSKAKETYPDSFGDARDRVKQLGKRDENTFDGAIRPKYAALNYANLMYGAAGQWGRSHMILKEYIKHNSTFVHTDSFDCSGSARQRAQLRGQVANYLNLQRLLVNMSPAMLGALNGASQGVSLGTAVQVPGVGSTAYVEAHCHADLRFEQDIKALVVCTDEVDEAEGKTAKLHSEDAGRWKEIKPKKLYANLEKFAKAYGIEIRYV